MRVPVGLTRFYLGPPGQRDPGQVGASMEMALLGHQSVVIAPLLDPCHKVPQSIEVEAHGPRELLLNKWHEVHWGPFFEVQCFLLMREEVCKE